MVPIKKDNVESAAMAAQRYAFEATLFGEMGSLYPAGVIAAVRAGGKELRQYVSAFGSWRESLALKIVLYTHCACRPLLPLSRIMAV